MDDEAYALWELGWLGVVKGVEQGAEGEVWASYPRGGDGEG